MDRLHEAICLGGLLGILHGLFAPVAAVPVVPNFGNLTSYAAGSASTLAGTIDRSHAITLTAGGAGSTATGQFVSEITVID